MSVWTNDTKRKTNQVQGGGLTLNCTAALAPLLVMCSNSRSEAEDRESVLMLASFRHGVETTLVSISFSSAGVFLSW